MAQAARLSLRMQKELKLLVTDPPPGASFPLLSSGSDLSHSLSTIDAEIEGPKGTVYAQGLFKLKIQIPERYPFQPPNVTFATPIYHPNIDNGGRICLDILNLPPKGAWQPSLNISTVLTSIGLLLSEPNPDDGLMFEASREYKYNRHTFDQKARAMTEKFARAGANDDHFCNKSSQALQLEKKGSDISKCKLDEGVLSNEKLHENSSKSSLEISKSLQNKGCEFKVSEKGVDEINWPKEAGKQILEEYHQHHENSTWTRRKLSLGSLVPREQRGDEEKENIVSKHHSSSSDSASFTAREVICDNNENPTLENRNKYSTSKRKKLGLVSKTHSLGLLGSYEAQQNDNKENAPEVQSLPNAYYNSFQVNDCDVDIVTKFSENVGYGSKLGTGDKLQQEPQGQLQGGKSEKRQEIECSILPESVIVLDSEDSEDEIGGCSRPRLLLARKKILGKSKAKLKY